MDYQKIIEDLNERKKPFLETKHFSSLPGIYAVYFHGDTFPDDQVPINKDELVYIGKTESSQQARDADTHFKSGKTGSSTIRRTIGALIRESSGLTPVPRNDKDLQKGRITFYKFDEPSEGKLSSFMMSNFSLSFYEYPKQPIEIDLLETKLIQLAKPIFNLAKNSNNPFGAYIGAKRKECGLIAHSKPESANKITPVSFPEQFTSHVIKEKSPLDFLDVKKRSNLENKYTLHEAMEIVLKEIPNRTATFGYLSDKIWERGLYKQKEGGSAPPSQIKLRARNYSQFEISGDKVRLIHP